MWRIVVRKKIPNGGRRRSGLDDSSARLPREKEEKRAQNEKTADGQKYERRRLQIERIAFHDLEDHQAADELGEILGNHHGGQAGN
jgi:hypothetical protein